MSSYNIPDAPEWKVDRSSTENQLEGLDVLIADLNELKTKLRPTVAHHVIDEAINFAQFQRHGISELLHK